MNWYLVYELTHFLLIIWRCRSFSTHCFHHFKKLLYDIFYFYIGIRIRKRNLKCGVRFFFWKLRKTCNWRKNKSQFISYIVNARVGLWNSTAEPKFTVLGLTKPRPIPWILSPRCNFTSHIRMRLFILHWYSMREVGKQFILQSVPTLPFPSLYIIRL